MEFKIVFKNIAYSVCIGYEGATFSQLHFITLTKEEYENFEVIWAKHLFGLLSYDKFKFITKLLKGVRNNV